MNAIQSINSNNDTTQFYKENIQNVPTVKEINNRLTKVIESNIKVLNRITELDTEVSKVIDQSGDMERSINKNIFTRIFRSFIQLVIFLSKTLLKMCSYLLLAYLIMFFMLVLVFKYKKNLPNEFSDFLHSIIKYIAEAIESHYDNLFKSLKD